MSRSAYADCRTTGIRRPLRAGEMQVRSNPPGERGGLTRNEPGRTPRAVLARVVKILRRESRRFPVGSSPTRRRVAPAGSSRSGGGGNESVEAFDETDHLGWFSESAGRNVRELSRPRKTKMREPASQFFREGRRRSGKKRQWHPTGPAGVVASACLSEGIDRNMGNPSGERP